MHSAPLRKALGFVIPSGSDRGEDTGGRVTLGQEQEYQNPVPLLTLTHSSAREGARHTLCCSVQAQQHNCRHVAQEQVM